jgi:outer membrane protein
MNRFVCAGLVALALAMSSVGALAQTPMKIAFVNSQQILETAPGRAEAQAQFDREVGQYRTQVQRMGDSLKAMIDDYNKQELILSPAAKAAKQKEIQTREATWQQRTKDLETQASQREQELIKPILEQVTKVLEAMRSEDGYTMILDVAAAGVVVAYDRNLDITPQVIQRLKSVTPKPAPAAGSKPATGATPAGATRPKTPPTDL